MRKPFHSYAMDIAEVVKRRSTCVRRQVGAVIAVDNKIVSTGYNGAPSGLRHCEDNENLCVRKTLKIKSGDRLDICRGVHAEQNAIIQAAKYGISINFGTIYVTVCPCQACAKMIINAGICSVVYGGDYDSNDSIILLKNADVRIFKVNEMEK